MNISSYSLSEPGARPYNEDSHRDATLTAGRCLIVADGTGGHRGGALASQLVVETALLYLAAAAAWDAAVLVQAIDAAGDAVHARQAKGDGLIHMSSTVALLCIDPHRAAARWAHLGDSRVLHFRQGAVRCLTRDHSLRQSLVDAGVITEGAQSSRYDRTMLYAAVGAEGDTRPVASEALTLESGDAFLLCTDGAWSAVEPEKMAALLGQAPTVEGWVQAIADAVRAFADPKQDNFTAVGVRVD